MFLEMSSNCNFFFERKRRKILNFRNSLFEFKMKFVFDIYDSISKLSYLSLMRVFLNHIKVQLKEGNSLINNIDQPHYTLFVHAMRVFFFFFFFFFFSSVLIFLKILDKFVLKTWNSRRVSNFVGILNRVGDIFLQGYPQVFSFFFI